MSVVSVAVYVVVEGELLALEDVSFCKDAHPHPLADDPLCDVAVWVAAVVREPTDPALLGRVEELVLLEHHKVEMADPRGGVLAHPLHERRLLDNLPNVLVDERVTGQNSVKLQPGFRFETLVW